MANDKSFKIKNGLLAGRYLGNNGTKTAGSNGPYGTFSTDLWTSDSSSSITVNNSIDLANDGGMVWIKSRSDAVNHVIVDTERVSGTTDNYLMPNLTNAQTAHTNEFGSFTSTGFTIPYNTEAGYTNFGTREYVAWTFKQASNFFDIVTYTGNGSTQNISHDLGGTVGTLIVKRTDSAGNWRIFHRSLGETQGLTLSSTGAAATSSSYWNNTAPTDTQFTVGTDLSDNGATFVAYLFAHDTSDDSYIKCDTTTGNGDSVNLGWKPAWLMIKRTDSTGNWVIFDNQRVTGTTEHYLYANTADAEQTSFDLVTLTDTGFDVDTGFPTGSYIYVAIRGVVPTQTLDLSTGHTFSITPTEATDVLFSSPPASGTATGFTVEVTNSGGYALTWPSSIKWHENTAPTATASKEVYTFITTDGGTTYYGKKAGENLA